MKLGDIMRKEYKDSKHITKRIWESMRSAKNEFYIIN